MSNVSILLNELENEAITTRKFLAIVPEDKFDWQPHPKSMTIQRLATHIAELPGWVKLGFTTDGIDFATGDWEPQLSNTAEELIAFFEKSLQEAREYLEKATDKDLLPKWTMRAGEEILADLTVGDLVRVSISQTIHHRAQLGVFLRLLDIPIPGSYGPSADELQVAYA